MDKPFTLNKQNPKYPAPTDNLISSLPTGKIVVSILNPIKVFIPIAILAADVHGSSRSYTITDKSELDRTFEVLPNAVLQFVIDPTPDVEYKIRVSNILILPPTAK